MEIEHKEWQDKDVKNFLRRYITKKESLFYLQRVSDFERYIRLREEQETKPTPKSTAYVVVKKQTVI